MEEDGESISFRSGLLISETPLNQNAEKFWVRDPRTGLCTADAMHNWKLAKPLDARAQWQPLTFGSNRLKQLRADQEAAKAAWLQKKRGVVVMATGTGKTEVALHITREMASHTLFVAPTRALAYQLAARIADGLGVDVGFIGDNTYRLQPISVATYQSAGIKMEFLGDYFKLIVFDECHHLPGDLRSDAARMSAAPFRLGLTATPQRSDGREGLYEELIGPVCHVGSIDSARGTLLADYTIRRIPVYLTDSERAEYDHLGRTVREFMAARRTIDPRYDWKDLSRDSTREPDARHALRARIKRRSIEENAAAKLDVLEDLFREHLQQVVVFTGSNSMARTVSTRFLIPCLLSHSKRKEREVILAGYESGAFKAIVANRVLNEGIDVPAAKIGIVVGGTGSERDAIQRLGRILRKRGVERAVLYEVVCAETGEEGRSRDRRRNVAYKARSAV